MMERIAALPGSPVSLPQTGQAEHGVRISHRPGPGVVAVTSNVTLNVSGASAARPMTSLRNPARDTKKKSAEIAGEPENQLAITDRVSNPDGAVKNASTDRIRAQIPDADRPLHTPVAGFRSDAQQLEIIQRYQGMPCLGLVDGDKGMVATTHAQSVLATSSDGTRRYIESATFDALCLAEEIHLIVKIAFTFGTGNKQIFLDRSGGENWVRVHMARATIDAKFSSDPEPADEAMVAVAHGAGSYWEHAMLSYALASNSGIGRPVFAVYDEVTDHTYVLIGDPWKEPEDKLTVLNPWRLTPIAHTLADSTRHFPCRGGVEIIATHDPKKPKKTKTFSMESAWRQRKISAQDIAEYVFTRNHERQAMGMQPLPENFGPQFLNVLTDNGENRDWIFDSHFSIADPNIIYQDDLGRARSFNTLPLEYVQRYMQIGVVESLTHSGIGDPVKR